MATSTAEPTVTVRHEGAVAVVSLNRPRRLNAVVPELVDDLLATLDGLDGAPVRAVVLTGAGRAFCAGHDLKQPQRSTTRRQLERIQEVTRRIQTLPQPVLAAVNGYAIGAGAEFALGCDLVLAADDAEFAFPEVGVGLSVTGGASRLLPLLLGPHKAKELLLLGRRVDATTARHIGLVTTVVAADDLLAEAIDTAATIAAKPTAAVTLAKRAIDAGIDSSLPAALELEVSHALVTDAGAAADTVTAFREHGTATS